jgi:hypothetical protein
MLLSTIDCMRQPQQRWPVVIQKLLDHQKSPDRKSHKYTTNRTESPRNKIFEKHPKGLPRNQKEAAFENFTETADLLLPRNGRPNTRDRTARKKIHRTTRDVIK